MNDAARAQALESQAVDGLGASSFGGFSQMEADAGIEPETPHSNGAGDQTDATALSESEIGPDPVRASALNGMRMRRR